MILEGVKQVLHYQTGIVITGNKVKVEKDMVVVYQNTKCIGTIPYKVNDPEIVKGTLVLK